MIVRYQLARLWAIRSGSSSRRRFGLGAMALAGLSCASDPPEPPPPPPAPPAATAQLFEEQQIQGAPEGEREWSVLPDFDALRREYGDRDDFAERCELRRPTDAVYEAIEREDWAGALAISTPALDLCPVDIDLHLAHAVALRGLGLEAEAQHHLRWHRGLVDSVLESGDGKTPETAWVVISVAEEYAILRVFGMTVRAQALLEGRIDRLEVEAEGKLYTVYFDPSAHFLRLGAPPPLPESAVEPE